MAKPLGIFFIALAICALMLSAAASYALVHEARLHACEPEGVTL